MNWFLLSLIGPFLWAIGNHIDKILIEKYFKNKSMGSLMIFSSLIGLFFAPIILIFRPNVLNISPFFILVLFLSSIIYLIYIWSYLKALENEEASVAIPFFQLIPVFAFILGYFFLGETITRIQFLAMILIIAGACILSFEIDEENKFRLRKKTVFFMTISSLASAIESVIFKYIILKEDFWVSTFWYMLWIGVIGLLMLWLVKKYRKDFIYIIKNNSKAIIGLNGFNEILNIIGNTTINFAFLLAPISLVLLAGAYQPVFVLLIGILLTIFIPKIISEKIKLKHIIQKVFVIAIMLVGTYLLFV